jgi:hypothetical protein
MAAGRDGETQNGETDRETTSSSEYHSLSAALRRVTWLTAASLHDVA